PVSVSTLFHKLYFGLTYISNYMCLFSIFVIQFVYQIGGKNVRVQQPLYPYNLGCIFPYKFLCNFNRKGFKPIKDE
ncbi:hypothetical protein BAVI_13504, partial [Neobacillus vireti LMG 21834]